MDEPGHAIGATDAGGQKEPAGQISCVVVVGQKKPAAHAAHAATEILPVSGLYVPGGHGVGVDELPGQNAPGGHAEGRPFAQTEPGGG